MSYWLKYTLFLIALPLAAWLAAYLLWQGWRDRRAWLRVALLGFGLALPIAALVAVNAWQSRSLSESATGARSLWKAEDLRSARPLPVALGVAGAPGLALFQSHLSIRHLFFFSDGRLRFLRPLDGYERLLLVSLAGLPGTALLLWAVAACWRRRFETLRPLAVTAACGFYAALGAARWRFSTTTRPTSRATPSASCRCSTPSRSPPGSPRPAPRGLPRGCWPSRR